MTIPTSALFGQDQGKVLNDIAGFADRVCQTVPLKSRSSGLQLSGEMNAELKGLLSRLAKLGLEGAARYQEAESEGVLQKDLAELLGKGTECRERLSGRLIDKLIPQKEKGKSARASEAQSKLAFQQTSSGADSPNIVGDHATIYYGGSKNDQVAKAPPGSVELPATFPGEYWKPASREDYSWLIGDWCYPSLRGFRSRFRIGPSGLQQQNSDSGPSSFVTEWINVEVFVSNRGMYRIRHANEWPGSYLALASKSKADFYENERGVKDDGTVEAGSKRLALNCARCSTSSDGFSYSCR